nr:type I methionyl aminopeptidase [Caldalkalibacillus salinus]
MKLKSASEIDKMHQAGKLLAACHRELRQRIKPGVSTMELNDFVEQFLNKYGATPEQKGYMGYPYATCASVNDVICHGMPTPNKLTDGDIVTIDMVVNLDGWLADSAWSYPVGQINPEAQQLLQVTQEALNQGIGLAKVGNRIGDIAHAIQTFVEGQGYAVVKDFCGHGIGQEMHEDPEVPHFGEPHQGPELEEGMVLTIEPMVNVGTDQLYIDDDGWTARTLDGQLSAQYEHTLAITHEGPVILTSQDIE